MVLVLLSFCNWWFLWWILPFILGLLLGSILWRSSRNRIETLERELATAKANSENQEYQLKKLKTEKEDAEYQLQRVKSQNDEMTTSMARLKQQQKKTIVPPIIAPSSSTRKPETGLIESKNVNPLKEENKKQDKTKEDSGKEKTSSYGEVSIPDTNLQIIEGIGPRMEAILKENDITSWYDLTKKSGVELKTILDKYGGRYSIVDPSGWTKQAKLAHKGKWDKLVKLQSEDGSKSKAETFLKKKR